MNSLLSWIVSNKLLVGMTISFVFTVGWGVASWLNLGGAYCHYYNYCVDNVFLVAENMWISILVLGSLAFLGTSGCYIRNRIKSRQETQTLEFDTSAVELAAVGSVVHNIIDPTQNKLTEEDLDKEISLFEKRKKLAQLKNEVINLETVGIRASTSSSLGQVVVARRDY